MTRWHEVRSPLSRYAEVIRIFFGSFGYLDTQLNQDFLAISTDHQPLQMISTNYSHALSPEDVMGTTYSTEQFRAVIYGLGYLPNGQASSATDAGVQSPEEALCSAICAFQKDYRIAISGTLDATTQERARQLIRNLQYSLNLVLATQLPLSEFYSSATTTAVEAFQRQRNLPMTGIATTEFRRTLEQDVKQHLRSRFCYASRSTKTDIAASALS